MTPFDIIVADRIAPAGVAFLRQQPGFNVTEAYGSSKEQMLGLVSNASAIVVRSETFIDADIIAAAPKLQVVGRAGVGVDNIDVDAATERGIVVVNTPSGNTIATAELTFTHMLCAARPIAQADASMKSGKWNRKALQGIELKGKTLAILGLGRIGTEVAHRAQSFGMRVIAYDPFLSDARAKTINVEKVSLDKIWGQADFITVHMPLTDATRNIVGRDAFANMKDGVRLINCARGGLIEEEALHEAIQSGKVAAAGLDVYENEPLPADHPMRQCANLVMTPHLGASTEEAQTNVGIEIAETVSAILTQGLITNAVNMPSMDAHTLHALKPYLRLGTILGTIAQQISPDAIERLEITFYGKIVDLDSMPITRAIQKGYLNKISGDRINDVNAAVKMKHLGIDVEITKSNADTPYIELIEVCAISGGERYMVEGTLMGRDLNPRIVGFNGRDIEISPSKYLLIVENKDMLGMVGMLGTILGNDGSNIANMSLNRKRPGETALTVFELDSRPSQKAINEMLASDRILKVQLVSLDGMKLNP